MRKILVSFLLVFVFCCGVIAQNTGTPASVFAVDEVGPDIKTVSAYTYRYYLDGSTTGVTIANVTCTGTASPFTCRFPFPAFTPGSHSIQFTAANAAGESGKSTPFTFTMVLIPSTPGNIRVE